MQEVIIRKLYEYIRENNPDVFTSLQTNGGVTTYLKEKVSSIDTLLNELIAAGTPPSSIEEICMKQLTADLRPSRYLYIDAILETEFPSIRDQLKSSGLLTTEILNMMQACKQVFEVMDFSEATQENKLLYYALAGALSEYLEKMKVTKKM